MENRGQAIPVRPPEECTCIRDPKQELQNLPVEPSQPAELGKSIKSCGLKPLCLDGCFIGTDDWKHWQSRDTYAVLPAVVNIFPKVPDDKINVKNKWLYIGKWPNHHHLLLFNIYQPKPVRKCNRKEDSIHIRNKNWKVFHWKNTWNGIAFYIRNQLTMGTLDGGI